MFANVARKLSNLDFVLELFLEASVQYLTLRRLEPIKQMRNGTNIISLGEKHELTVDKVRVVDTILLSFTIIDEGVLLNTV